MMLEPTGAPPGIDVDRVTAWLAERLADLVAPLRFVAVGHGRSNITYRVEDAAGGVWVLRRPPLGALLPSAHDMMREHRVITALSAAGVPVPKTVGACRDPAVTGAPFYVMEHVDGLVLHSSDIVAAVPEAARRRSMLSLIEGLGALQALDIDEIGLGDLGRREGYAARQLRRWRKQWEASMTRDIPTVDRVADRLEAGIPDQEEVVLVHGDFRLDNVIVGPDGHLRAILDWELAALGDPLADLGTWLAFTPGDSSEVMPLHDPVALMPGFPSHDEVLDAYVRATGRDLSALPFWHALSLWKLAIIMQGVYSRWREDPRNGGAGAADLEPVVEWLAGRAEQAAGTGPASRA
jgi:aminoglycoside phosphotransferase (APT) family kinase protein